MKKEKNRYDLKIKIKNVTAAQAIAIESFLSMWEILGGLGGSRWTSFFADGDGNFRPKIEVNGKKAVHTTLLTKDQIWVGNKYEIDFDTIAWILSNNNDEKLKVEKHLKSFFIINKIKSIYTFWRDLYARRKSQKSKINMHPRHCGGEREDYQREQPGEDS